MARLDELLAGDTPTVAVSFSESADEQLVKEAVEAGVDVAELRIDRHSDPGIEQVVEHARLFATVPTIATIRSQAEGGDWGGSEEQRMELFSAVLSEVDGVDIELSSSSILPGVIERARELGKTTIVSFHDFESTPPQADLEDIITRAKGTGADYVKVSTMANSMDDLRLLADITLKWRHVGLIVIAMGALGAASRVFFPGLGSCLTYAWIGGRPAPGQLEYAETFHMLRTFYPQYNQTKIKALRLMENL